MHAFLRNEFQQFGREPPPEFTDNQRSLFCVFSGTCVKRLRDYLNTAPEYEGLREAARYRPRQWLGLMTAAAGAGAVNGGEQQPEVMEGIEGQVPLPPPPAPAVPPGLVAGGTPVVGTPTDDTPDPESET